MKTQGLNAVMIVLENLNIEVYRGYAIDWIKIMIKSRSIILELQNIIVTVSERQLSKTKKYQHNNNNNTNSNKN